jgi:hypothetical protein
VVDQSGVHHEVNVDVYADEQNARANEPPGPRAASRQAGIASESCRDRRSVRAGIVQKALAGRTEALTREIHAEAIADVDPVSLV